jgi:large subunit ribosomal protein L10
MRPEKELMVKDIVQRIQAMPFVLLTDYTGMKVQHFAELRNRLAGASAEYRVVKNTLLRRALKQVEFPEADAQLTGQTAVVIGDKDVSVVAKVLKTFAAEFEKPVMKGGIVDQSVLTSAQIKALADLPSRDVLLAQILGVISAPAQRLVRLVNTPASQLAQVLRAHSEKAEGAS